VVFARAPVILAIAAVLIGLTPAAYADPADPTWIAGYWDDDDFDNAVEFIVSACAVEALCPVDFGPLFAPVARVDPKEAVDWVSPLRSPASARAPPAAFARPLLIAS
jgi:hypothetical protein